MSDTRLQRICELESELKILHRRALLMLLFFAVAFSGLAWERAQIFRGQFDALCLGSSILIALYVAYAFGQQRELERIRDGKAISVCVIPSSTN